tara:strand:+ start:171 stop:500 length:330 start_codon:yes stop_codon:yes gene_type:complete
LFSTILDFFFYTLLISEFSISASNAKKLSYVAGTLNSFIFNKKITFKSQGKSINELIKYLLVWGVSFSINSFSHDFSSNYFEGYIPFTVATLISIIINFFGAKFWVFKK